MEVSLEKREEKKGNWNSEFKREVGVYGIKIIRTGVNHPQTNGKLEKLNDTYNKTRDEH